MATTAEEPLDQQVQAGQLPITISSTCNTTAPVLRLPFDIIEQIFLIYVRWCHYDENRGVARVPQWVNASYVCRRWREAILNFQTLWSYMFIASQEWSDALLARSGEVPLRIIVDFSSNLRDQAKAFKFMQQVLPHAGRLQECIIHLRPEDVTIVLPMLSLGSGALRPSNAIPCYTYAVFTLEITLPYTQSCWHRLNVAAENGLEGIGTAMGHTFNNNTPALRELHLRNYPLSWCPQTLGALKVLTLRDLCRTVRPTIAQLKSVLSGMPGLERLELEDAVGGDYDRKILDAEKVQLPRLSYLVVTGYLFRIAPLLFSLKVPLTARVRVGCRLQTTPEEKDHQPFFAFLSSIFGNCPLSRPRTPDLWHTLIMRQTTARMYIVLCRTLQHCGRPECSYSPMVDCGCDMPMKVAIEWPPGTEHHHDVVYSICRSISLVPMRRLLVANCELRQEFWLDLIWHIQNLQSIQFFRVNFKDILHLLGLPARLHPDHADMDPQVFVQSLKYLFLNNVMIDRQVRCGGNSVMHGGMQVAQFAGCSSSGERRWGTD
ncbi:hypothetical protein JVU11DRAFT_9489 [Chiua virens]|nr:hypothetical protein JVU11DRAFT_9489 [Chiua virens]